jgi:hypothetical protein
VAAKQQAGLARDWSGMTRIQAHAAKLGDNNRVDMVN